MLNTGLEEDERDGGDTTSRGFEGPVPPGVVSGETAVKQGDPSGQQVVMCWQTIEGDDQVADSDNR